MILLPKGLQLLLLLHSWLLPNALQLLLHSWLLPKLLGGWLHCRRHLRLWQGRLGLLRDRKTLHGKGLDW